MNKLEKCWKLRKQAKHQQKDYKANKGKAIKQGSKQKKNMRIGPQQSKQTNQPNMSNQESKKTSKKVASMLRNKKTRKQGVYNGGNM